mmetsp:Transcript_81176/g.149497  ORF Transcript_81176/g.149497 Transcript_81176/m.149497 type:complete len:87 (-) Transcript_81176:8-268(-)
MLPRPLILTSRDDARGDPSATSPLEQAPANSKRPASFISPSACCIGSGSLQKRRRCNAHHTGGWCNLGSQAGQAQRPLGAPVQLGP